MVNMTEAMTNDLYRKSRGTHKPFTATPEQIAKAWYKMNKAAIDRRRKWEKKFKRAGRVQLHLREEVEYD